MPGWMGQGSWRGDGVTGRAGGIPLVGGGAIAARLTGCPRRPPLRGLAPVPLPVGSIMSLEQLKAFLVRMQQDETLKQRVLAAATADDVAQIALAIGYEFSGDELLRVSGQRFDRVTVRKNDIPGEYN